MRHLKIVDTDTLYVILQRDGAFGMSVLAWRSQFLGRPELFVSVHLLTVELRIVYTHRPKTNTK